MGVTTWVPITVFSVLAVAILIGLVVTRETWARRKTVGKVAYAFGMGSVCAVEWALCYLFELVSTEPTTKLFWYNLKQMGIDLILPFLFLFVLYYNDPTFQLRSWKAVLIFAEPIVMIVLFFTNAWHHLILDSYTIRRYLGFQVLVPKLTRIDVIDSLYSVFFFAGVLALLVANYVRSPRFYRAPLQLILFGIVFAAGGSIITGFNLIDQHFDLSPLCFVVTLPLFHLSLKRYKMFVAAPVARDLIFDHMDEGAVLLNPDREVLDFNLAARHILTNATDSIEPGQNIDTILPPDVDFDALQRGEQIEIERLVGDETHCFLFHIAPLDLGVAANPYTMLMISDVTERARAQQQLRESNRLLEAANQQLEVTNQRIEEQIAVVTSQTAQLQFVNSELHKKRRIETEVGAQVQQSLLVSYPPQSLQGVQIATLSLPSQQVDGDFCDFYVHSDTTFDVVVGDVMGKGLSAALLGAATKSQLLRATNSLLSHAGSTELPSPQQLVQHAHRRITPRLIELDTFVTIAYARFDLAREELLFVDCGHTATIHYCGATAETRLLQGGNVPLGVLEEEVYQQYRVSIAPGDLIVFYSDGVTEARDPAQEMYGFERLRSLIVQESEGPCEAIAESLRRDLQHFTGSASFADDVTCIIVSIEATGAMSGWTEIETVLEPVFVMEAIRSQHLPASVLWESDAQST